MTVITITREAKCKDCVNISLFHYGKKKRFICDLGNELVKGKESKICRDNYTPRMEYYIKNQYANNT